jgi:RimJ/RimL family protein N-acetyltransferase
MAEKILNDVEGPEETPGVANFTAFILDKSEEPVAGLLFYGFSKYNIFLTIIIYQPKKVTREKINQVFSFAFEYPFQIYRITALVSSTNRRSQVLMKKTGFHKEGECIGFNGTEDDVTIVYRYTQKDWYGSKFYGKSQIQ